MGSLAFSFSAGMRKGRKLGAGVRQGTFHARVATRCQRWCMPPQPLGAPCRRTACAGTRATARQRAHHGWCHHGGPARQHMRAGQRGWLATGGWRRVGAAGGDRPHRAITRPSATAEASGQACKAARAGTRRSTRPSLRNPCTKAHQLGRHHRRQGDALLCSAGLASAYNERVAGGDLFDHCSAPARRHLI